MYSDRVAVQMGCPTQDSTISGRLWGLPQRQSAPLPTCQRTSKRRAQRMLAQAGSTTSGAIPAVTAWLLSQELLHAMTGACMLFPKPEFQSWFVRAGGSGASSKAGRTCSSMHKCQRRFSLHLCVTASGATNRGAHHDRMQRPSGVLWHLQGTRQ